MKNQEVALKCSFNFLGQLYWKETPVGDSLWISRNSQEHLFYRKPPDDYFWKWRKYFEESPCKLCLFSSDGAGYISILAIFSQKVPQKFITSHNLFVIWRDSSKIIPCRTRSRWNKYFQDFSYSILKECLTVCFIVFDKKNIKIKMLNFILANIFLFSTLQLLSIPEAALGVL